MNIDIEAAADAIMSARHSDVFDREACKQIITTAIATAWNDGWNKRDLVAKHLEREAAQPKPESWQQIAR